MGDQNGVGLDATDGSPSENQILDGLLVRRLAGNQLPRIRIIARSVDEISGLHQQTTVNLTELRLGLRRFGNLQNTKILLLGLQQLKGIGIIVGSDDHFGEDRTDAFCHFHGDLAVRSDHTTIGTHRVASMRLLVRLSDGGSNGKAARIVVLDHGNRNLRSEIPHGTPSCIGINIVVVAHRLATELFSMREAVLVQRIEIQRGLLVRILTIAQNMGTIPGTGECNRELGLIQFRLTFGSRLIDGSRLRPMLRGPLIDGGIIRRRVSECFAGQPATFLKGETFTVLDTGRDQRIIVRIRDDGHGGVVLRRSANHGRASDIDLFNSGSFVRTGTNRISERI